MRVMCRLEDTEGVFKLETDVITLGTDTEPATAPSFFSLPSLSSPVCVRNSRWSELEVCRLVSSRRVCNLETGAFMLAYNTGLT